MAQLHTILGILQARNGLDGLKRLFWQELNYPRENTPLSMRSWPERAGVVMAEAPVFFTRAGEDNAFHSEYCRLAVPEVRRGTLWPFLRRPCPTSSAVKHLCGRWLTAISTNSYQQAQYVCF
mgnify:FL=1